MVVAVAASDRDELELELVAPTLILQVSSMTRVDGLQICPQFVFPEF